MFSLNPFSKLEAAPRGERAQAREIKRLAAALKEADAVLIGAGAGLSTAAGFTYSGERLERYFGDFVQRYSFADMYSGGFFPFPTPEEQWAYWSRYIWINRYAPAPSSLYQQLFELVRDRDYFVITTNVDHQFQCAGFDKHRLFYTQGDYGLWQCSEPCHSSTYDNEDAVRKMLEAQGFGIADDGQLLTPSEKNALAQKQQNDDGTSGESDGKLEGGTTPTCSQASSNRGPLMRIPSELVPHCPRCGKPMSMNLRADDTFVEDEGWHAAAARYQDFLRRHEGMRMLCLELGVGWNTPVIVKYPFWKLTAANPRATYACLNFGEAVAPRDIARQSILVNGDIASVIAQLS